MFTGTARVLVTIEVPLSDSWGGDCTVEQIHKQAAESARNVLHGLVDRCERPIGAQLKIHDMKIIAVMAERQK